MLSDRRNLPGGPRCTIASITTQMETRCIKNLAEDWRDLKNQADDFGDDHESSHERTVWKIPYGSTNRRQKNLPGQPRRKIRILRVELWFHSLLLWMFRNWGSNSITGRKHRCSDDCCRTDRKDRKHSLGPGPTKINFIHRWDGEPSLASKKMA